MSQNADTNPIYVFVVLSLAAFLMMFAFTRDPGIVYKTQAVLRVDAKPNELVDAATATKIQNEFSSRLLDHEFLLDAMRAADMVRGETTPQLLAVARDIAERMSLTAMSHQPLQQQGHTRVQLALVTERPDAGIALLTELSRKAKETDARIETFAPFVANQAGGSIDQFQWFLLASLSTIIGLVGLVLADRARKTRMLIETEHAEEVLPVVADFCDREDLEYVGAVEAAQNDQRVRRRTFITALRIAEVAVAAVFLLMIYHLATKQTLLDRFIANPLAAYSEVLSSVIG